MLDPHILARLKDAAGPQGWTEDPADIAPHLVEDRGRWKGQSALLLKPKTTAEVVAILKACHETGTPVVPQGGNTGLVGGQIAMNGEVILSLRRLNQVRSVSPADNTMIVEAGVTLAQAQQLADDANRLFPLSLGSQGSCTIGGNLSTNAGGVGVLRYGMMRELVLGLEVVLADGRVLDTMRGLRKDNTGYDLKQMFIGAEGTLGVITAAMLKLFPKPAGHATVFVGLTDKAVAVDLLNRIQQDTGNLVTAFEIIPRIAMDFVTKHIAGVRNPLPDHQGWSVLLEVSHPAAFDATAALEEALARAITDGLVADAVFAKSEQDRIAFWKIRETIPEAQKPEGASLKNDVSVPLTKITEFLDSADKAVRAALPGVRPVAFGHIGDGNIHFNISAASPAESAKLLAARDMIEHIVLDEVYKRGGSISAEHGLGQAKNETIAHYKGAVELDVMRTLKRAMDPKNILNPGKTLPNAGH